MDAQATLTYPDGRSENIHANAGSVQHMDAFTHLPEGIGKTLFEVIQTANESSGMCTIPRAPSSLTCVTNGTNQLIVAVADPEAAVQLIRNAL